MRNLVSPQCTHRLDIRFTNRQSRRILPLPISPIFIFKKIDREGTKVFPGPGLENPLGYPLI